MSVDLLTYFFILLFSIYLTTFKAEELCPRTSCSDYNFENEECAKVERVEEKGNNYSKVSVDICPYHDQYCDLPSNFYNLKDPAPIYYCKDVNYLPKVDGEKCLNDEECGSSVCENKRCIGKRINEACTNTVECASGLYCDNTLNKCSQQKKEGSACTYEYECENSCGCYRNVCTAYWSLDSGTQIGSDEDAELYCSTSVRYNNKCTYIVNNQTNPYGCDDNVCKYIDADNNQILNIPELCSCGYNDQGKKYCQHGSNSLTYERYLEVKMNVLQRGCHVSKKLNCTNLVTNLDYINMKNLYNAWKGKYQLSDLCVISFYSNSEWRKLSYYLFIFYLAIIFSGFI